MTLPFLSEPIMLAIAVAVVACVGFVGFRLLGGSMDEGDGELGRSRAYEDTAPPSRQ